MLCGPWSLYCNHSALCHCGAKAGTDNTGLDSNKTLWFWIKSKIKKQKQYAHLTHRLYFAIPCSSIYASNGKTWRPSLFFLGGGLLPYICNLFMSNLFISWCTTSCSVIFCFSFQKLVYLDLYNPAEKQRLGAGILGGKGRTRGRSLGGRHVT